MRRQMLKSKIHRATVTDCDPDYIGSVTIDAELMRQADLLPNEQVHVWDLENGARLVPYAIEGPAGSGQMQLNGAAARLVSAGDKVIVASYASYSDEDLEAYSPIVVHVDDSNRMVGVDSNPEVLLAALVERWSDEVPGSLGSGDGPPTGGLQ
jgi:aspartate 1-decarboxylase